MRVETTSIPALRSGLESLAETLESIEFRLPFPGREDHEGERVDGVRTIREYLLPRLRDPDAPVVAAIVGPTGTGKSTVMNSLAQDRISEAGALRPTTKSPVLWAHRDHGGRSWSEFVARVRERVGPSLEVVVGDDELTRHLTLIDTPPVDYRDEEGIQASREVLSLADLCVFVTSASRYADATGWQFLWEARRRGVPILFVLNRLDDDPGAQSELLGDFAVRLSEADLLLEPDPSLLFAVSEGGVERWHGGLQPTAVGLLRKELGELSEPEFRQALVDQTSYSAVRAIAERTRRLAAAFETERQAAERLTRAVNEAYDSEAEDLAGQVDEGALASLAEHDLWQQAAADLTGIVTRRAGVAAQHAAASWEEEPSGARFLEEGGQGLWRHGHDTTYETQRRLEAWAADVEEAGAKRARNGRMRRRARAKMSSQLWPAVLTPDEIPPRWLARRFKAGTSPLLADATKRLQEELRKALQVDATRFTDFVGDFRNARGTAEKLDEQAEMIMSMIEHPADRDESKPPAEAEREAGAGAERPREDAPLVPQPATSNEEQTPRPAQPDEPAAPTIEDDDDDLNPIEPVGAAEDLDPFFSSEDSPATDPHSTSASGFVENGRAVDSIRDINAGDDFESPGESSLGPQEWPSEDPPEWPSEGPQE